MSVALESGTLLDVNGVSERLLDEIAPYISFGSR